MQFNTEWISIQFTPHFFDFLLLAKSCFNKLQLIFGYLWALAHTAVYLGGSLVMTTLGILTVSLLKAKGAA